jgi:hypothetical protein
VKSQRRKLDSDWPGPVDDSALASEQNVFVKNGGYLLEMLVD